MNWEAFPALDASKPSWPEKCLLRYSQQTGGLQVLNREGQWIKAIPIEGTIVVNIGDFMMRLCNDIYKSTVHRVYNQSAAERVSMPFFFGRLTYPS
jgi:isopenicillin N synthase-like dioxygenase